MAEDVQDQARPGDSGPAPETLTPGPLPLPATDRPRQPPASAVAAALASDGVRTRSATWVHLASGQRRADEIGRALRDMAPDADVFVLPAWDCLPFDRASPSRDVMGRRMAVLRSLLRAGAQRRFLVISPESLVQRAPPREVVESAVFDLAKGEVLDREAFADFAWRVGYVLDDRVDEPGEIAVLGEVIDVFPAEAGAPVRIALGNGDQIVEMRVYDPISQRTEGEIDTLCLGPASELIRDPGSRETGRDDLRPGAEHRLFEAYPALTSLFDVLGPASLSQDDRAGDRLTEVADQIEEAFLSHRDLGLSAETPPSLDGLYLTRAEVAEGLARWTSRRLHLDAIAAAPNFASRKNPGRAFCDLVAEQVGAGRRVILTGLAHERRALTRALARGLELAPGLAADWNAARSGPRGEVITIDVDLDTGFIDERSGLVVIASADVLGGRMAERRRSGQAALAADPDLRIGDVVLHEDHGVGVLRNLETVVVGGAEVDTLRLEYHGGASLLAPVDEIGRIWRYGAEEAAVSLDRLKGDAWPRRRAEVSRHLEATATQLVDLAARRARAACPPIVPPAAAYARFAARFSYPETPDQAAAIEAVLEDLGSGRPMDRLVCGDVGFGKTEVALRAAAAVALSGRQVAIAAPTTVLARQHFHTFRRRFAGTGLEVAQLSRLAGRAEAHDVRNALRAGEVKIVVGTHALASEDVAFADLGLMIVDEEQKFGAALKGRLRSLAVGGHLLSMTATPIPRTLQAAMVGLQDVSVIASPPARRRPIRTFLAPFDPASVRTALLREHRRGGQSFIVAPRIEDLAPLSAQLALVAPELSVRIAHGELPADEVDSVMVGFADGKGDVLLATNIIESGLDVPRANTMLIWRPDRFGLSQLHQLRGRVGRGRVQGVAYLLSDPRDELSDATRARLSTLEAFDRLGSGLAISARDLDLRGGGDLVGEEQAGHMRMVGAALYQHLLDRALRVAKREAPLFEEFAALKLGAAGRIPVDHVPDAVTRINLYARLARMTSIEAIDDFAEELADRFGSLPEALETLLSQARLQTLARGAGVRAVAIGPKAIALTLRPGAAAGALRRVQRVAPDTVLKDDRIVAPNPCGEGSASLALVEHMLARLQTEVRAD